MTSNSTIPWIGSPLSTAIIAAVEALPMAVLSMNTVTRGCQWMVKELIHNCVCGRLCGCGQTIAF